MKIYLAGPLFNESERNFNHRVAKALRDNGYDVWLPQENFPASVEGEEEKKKVFEGDLKALRSSEAVVAVLDGECVDSGTAFEVGYAYALNVPVVGIKTDIRVFSSCEEVNLMVEKAVKMVRSADIQILLEDLLQTLKELQ